MKPLSINANRARKELTILWDDQHTCVISFSLLRAACPCAECRGGHDKMSSTPDPAALEANLPDSPATRLETLLAIGSYAVTPVWEDGHEAGIYSWDYLHALCL